MGENIENKENILNCALELFSAKGYESVSVQEIVNMAGVTKPTLYYYFGSKEGVYEKLLQTNYEKLNVILEKVAIYNSKPSSYFEDVYPVLINLTTSYFKFSRNNEKFYRMILINLFQPCSSSIYNVIKTYHFIQYEIVNKMFDNMACVHKNMIGKEKIMTWSYIGMVNSFIGLYFNDEAQIKLDEETEKMLVKQFMHGIFS